MEQSQKQDINALRLRIARMQHAAVPVESAAVLPFGAPAIDARIPAGGLLRGALHEAAGTGPATEHAAAAALFVAGILARCRGAVLWVLERADLFAPALACAGLPPARVIFVEAGRDVLTAVEDGLREAGLAGVVGETSRPISLTASRRLQLAAETSGVPVFLVRRSDRFDDPRLAEPNAAVTRWRITALASPPPLPHAPDVPGLATARWRLDLIRCRGGEPATWIVEACDAQGHLRLVSDLSDRSSAEDEFSAGGGGPLITAAHDGRRRVVAGANAAAQAIGITAGLPLASAQAMVPGLAILDATPTADADAITALAVWCLRYAPLVAADPPDGLWIDVTGCTHLAGGEAALLADLCARLEQAGFVARVAIADTPGIAYAVARYGGQPITVIAPSDGDAALATLPIEAPLRLSEDICDGLRRVGLERIGDLMTAPRAPLVRRFGTSLALRLAQACGEQFESIHPLTPPDVIERRLAFV
jgi:hypothetical protein